MPAAPSTSPLFRRAAWLTAATLAILAGCGGGGDENADPAKIAPRGAGLYLTATIRPDGDQKDAVNQIASKVFRVSDPGQRIARLMDSSFKRRSETRNLTFATDVKPWLGKRAALVVTGLGGASSTQAVAIIAAKDTGAAADTLNRVADDATPKAAKRSYKDVDYRFNPSDSSGVGVVGDYVVAGDESSFKAVVDAYKDKGLAQDSRFKSAARAGEGKLGFAYVDSKTLLAGLGAGGLPPGTLQSLVRSGDQPATVTLNAEADRVTLDSTAQARRGAAASTTPSVLIPELPGDSWLALGAPRVGESLRQATSQLSGGAGEAILGGIRQALLSQTGLDLDRDVLASLGDLAIFARGTSPLTIGGGVVVQTPDPAAARRLVDKLRPVVARQGAASGARVTSANVAGARGFKLGLGRLPGSVNVVVKGERLVVAYGDAATRDAFSAAPPLSSAPDYKAAQQSIGGASPSLFVSFASLAELVGSQRSPDAQQAKTYLSALKTIAAGAKAEGTRQSGRLVLTLK